MSFNPHENLTVDEQLLPCKARCKFIQYMSNKPDKFGIKFWLLVDLKTKYLCNGFPYLGKDEIKPVEESLPTFVVMKLMDGFYDQGYNVTTDNFFTSLFLAKKLLAKKTSLIGTIKSSRRELPAICKQRSALHSTKLLREEESSATLTVYQCKKNKNVSILSTLHKEVIILQQRTLICANLIA